MTRRLLIADLRTTIAAYRRSAQHCHSSRMLVQVTSEMKDPRAIPDNFSLGGATGHIDSTAGRLAADADGGA